QGVAVPDGVFKGAAAIVVLFRGAAFDVIQDAFDAGPGARTLLRGEGAAKAFLLDEVFGDVAELGGEVLVYEENVHGLSRTSKRLGGMVFAVPGEPSSVSCRVRHTKPGSLRCSARPAADFEMLPPQPDNPAQAGRDSG